MDCIIALILALSYVTLAIWSLPSTGVTWDENRYIAQAKARAYSLYSMASGKEDLFFCDLRKDFELSKDADELSNEWASRCWEGRPKLPITISGIGWAFVWFMNGGSLSVIQSIMAHRMPLILLNALGFIAIFFFIRESHGRRAAVFSVLAAIFMPRLFALSRYVLMDEAVGIFWVLTVWTFWKGLEDRRYGILSGVMLALALLSKEQALFIPFILFAWLLISYRDKLKAKFGGYLADLRKMKIPKLPASPLSIIFITPVVWVLFWPWLWYNTANRIMWWESYYLSHIEHGGVSVYFLGNAIAHPSWLYIVSLTIATIPLPMLILAMIGTWKAVGDTARLSNRVSMLILLSAVTPILVLSIVQVAYNGVQQFVQSFFFIAILAGIGADHVLKSKKIPQTLMKRNLLAALLLLLIVSPGLLAILKGHTDTYFSEIVGGASGVYNNNLFEVEWSGESYLDAAYWLNENAAENATIFVPMANNIFNTYKYGDIGQIAGRLDIGKEGLNASWFEQKPLLRTDIRVKGAHDINSSLDMESIDYIIVMSRFGLFNDSNYVGYSMPYVESCEPVYSVQIDGVPLTRIYRTDCLGNNRKVEWGDFA